MVGLGRTSSGESVHERELGPALRDRGDARAVVYGRCRRRPEGRERRQIAEQAAARTRPLPRDDRRLQRLPYRRVRTERRKGSGKRLVARQRSARLPRAVGTTYAPNLRLTASTMTEA